MTPENRAPRPTCPKCHLPVREHEPAVFHEGKTYHRGCAPKPAAGKPGNPYSDETPIAI